MSRNEFSECDTDHAVILRCKEGDVDAFEELVRRYQKRMFNIAYRITGDNHDSAEVVQDAFVSVYRNLRNFRGEARFTTWLSTIVVNLSRNRLRQIKTRAHREMLTVDDPFETNDGAVNSEPASYEMSILEKLQNRELRQEIQECMQLLDSEFREVIVLRDMQGFSYREIADMLKVAEGTIKSRLSRARESMRNCLKKTRGDS
jgi:RNA polymerase sigma-70 factor (ECF subfamily)